MYDDHGNLKSIVYEDDTHEDFTYYADGLLQTWTNRRGQVITYTYWPSGQLKTKDYSTTLSLVDYSYDYDDIGNLTSATGPDHDTTPQSVPSSG